MRMVLELDGKEVLHKLAGSAVDERFSLAVEEAVRLKETSEASWGEALQQVMDTGDAVNLAPYFVRKDRELSFDQPDSEVAIWIDNQFSKFLDENFLNVRNRVNHLGDFKPSLIKEAKRDRIVLEIPGFTDTERLRDLVSKTYELGFWKSFSYENIAPLLQDVNEQVNIIEEVFPYVNTDSLLAGNEEQRAKFEHENPFWALFNLSVPLMPENPQLAYAQVGDTAAINAYLKHPNVKRILGDTRFIWMAKPEKDLQKAGLALIAIKDVHGGQPEIDGSVIEEASVFENEWGWVINIRMNGEGAKTWERLTRNQMGGFIAIVVDNLALSVPRVNSPILGGNSQISGDFTLDEAADLAQALRAGKMMVPMKVLETRVIGKNQDQPKKSN